MVAINFQQRQDSVLVCKKSTFEMHKNYACGVPMGIIDANKSNGLIFLHIMDHLPEVLVKGDGSVFVVEVDVSLSPLTILVLQRPRSSLDHTQLSLFPAI